MPEVRPFYTDSADYDDRETRVYHNRTECEDGQRMKAAGDDLPGHEDHDLCDRCRSLASDMRK